MNLKMLSVAVAIGGALFCCQPPTPRPTDSLRCDVVPGLAEGLKAGSMVGSIQIDRANLSHQLLPAEWDSPIVETGIRPASDIAALSIAPSESNSTLQDSSSIDSASIDMPQPSDPSQAPSPYQQKLADQRAWRSHRRAVQLSVPPSNMTNVNVVLSTDLVVNDSPIVPGIDDPHQWHETQSVVPSNTPAIVTATSSRQTRRPLLNDETTNRKNLAKAIAAAEAAFKPKTPTPALIGLDRSQSDHRIADASTNRPTAVSLIDRQSSPQQHRLKSARGWETGRY